MVQKKHKKISIENLLSYPDSHLPEDARLIKNYFIKLIRSLPNNVYWLDRNCITLGCNDNVLKILELATVEDFIGIDYDQMGRMANWTEGQAKSFKKDDMQVIKSGLPMINKEEPVVYDRNGNPQYYISNRLPLFDEQQHVIGVVGISVDITSQKQAEALHLKNTVNEEKMETMKMLAASIAHEIRTPLAAVKAQGSVVESFLPTLLEAYNFALEAGQVKRPLRKSQLAILEHLPEELNRITSSANVFIDMLLTKVNFESLKEKSMQLTKLSAKEAVMSAMNNYPLDQHSASLLRCDYKKSFEFMGDEVLFQHVIFNLLKNAIYFVRATGRPGEIKIWFEQQQDHNILHFRDTGKGISKESLPNIFNSFYTRTRHGTGVGLAFCKLIIESFGGDIRCDSVEDKYTHFMLSFPKVETQK